MEIKRRNHLIGEQERWGVREESMDIPLSENVKAAIRRNRKIEAIKILREEQNFGLKEAKEIVEAQWDVHRGSGAAAEVRQPKMESGMGRVVWIVIVLAALYGLFRYFG